MPILIRSGSESQMVSAVSFPKEKDLELLLADFPDLLREEGGPSVAFVDRQVNLPDAGKLDLLFVDDNGLPIAVEVKLYDNAQARREVVVQVIDYLSSLTALTVDELDQQVNKKLDAALRALAGDDDKKFDGLWEAAGRIYAQDRPDS
jgi:hypothetical protein